MTSHPDARILIAPDSFGDTLSAVAAAEAIASGWSSVRPADDVRVAPQSDGGPGFVAVLAARTGERRTVTVSGPLGAAVLAEWLFVADPGAGEPPTAYLECAQACGLHLLGGGPTPRTAVSADTRGVGELLCAALDAGARRIVVGLGGSATTDGGRGLIEAMGGPVRASERLADIDLVAASDVENPLLGRSGAAEVFGPQKGADAATVAHLEERMAGWSRELAAIAGRDVSADAGAGAAGGLGATLLALGARRVPGATIVADATGLDDDIAAADLLITGEGRFDTQTLAGKVIAALTAGATAAHVPVIVLAGQVSLSPAQVRGSGVSSAHSIVDIAGSVEVAMSDAAAQLTRLAVRVAQSWTP